MHVRLTIFKSHSQQWGSYPCFSIRNLKFKIVVSQLLWNLYMRDIELNCIFLAEKRRYLPYFWMIPLWIRYTSLNMEGHEDYVSLTNQILSDECRISKCFKHKNICNYNYCHFRCLNYPSVYLPVYPRRSIYLIIYLYICLFSIFLSI